jgi:arginyl-tRNA synthetase
LDRIKGRIIQFALSKFNVALDNIAYGVPPRIELGDLAFPVAFELAKRVKAATGQKANPREIATQLAEILKSERAYRESRLPAAAISTSFSTAPEVFNQLVAGTIEPAAGSGDKLIVEHNFHQPQQGRPYRSRPQFGAWRTASAGSCARLVKTSKSTTTSTTPVFRWPM